MNNKDKYNEKDNCKNTHKEQPQRLAAFFRGFIDILQLTTTLEYLLQDKVMQFQMSDCFLPI